MQPKEEASIIKLSFEALKKSDFKDAIKYVDKAKLWPRNLGAGQPYNVDERLENSILAYSYNKLNDKENEETHVAKIKTRWSVPCHSAC